MHVYVIKKMSFQISKTSFRIDNMIVTPLVSAYNDMFTRLISEIEAKSLNFVCVFLTFLTTVIL